MKNFFNPAREVIHQLKEVDMLSAKMDLLIKRLKDRANEKQEVTLLSSWCRA
jgi:uncharacterized coiled-coil protein SlyX